MFWVLLQKTGTRGSSIRKFLKEPEPSVFFLNQITAQHGYGVQFAQLFCQVHFSSFSKPILPNHQVHIAIWLFCQVYFTSLPTPLYQIAKVLIAMSTFPSLQLHITIWLFSQIVYLAELLSPLHLVDNLNKLQAAHKFRLHLIFSFPTGCPGLLPSFLLSLSLPLT